MSFCDDIRILLHEKELSCGELSAMLSLDEARVSCWESGAALPDGDSLCKLRELFPDVQLPIELYSFTLDEQEVGDYFRFFSRKAVKRNLLYALLFLALGLFGRFADIPFIGYISVFLIAFYILLSISVLSRNAKGKKATVESFRSRLFEYCIYPEHLSVTLWDGERCYSCSTYRYSEAKDCRRTDKYIFPLFSNGALIIPIGAIAADSMLHRVFDPKAVRAGVKGHRSLKTISLILTMLSIIAFLVGMALIILSHLQYIAPINLSTTLVVAFLPGASLIFGLVTLLTGRREGRIASFAGSLVIFLLALISVLLPSPDIYENHVDPGVPGAEELLGTAEKALGTELPQPYNYNIYEYGDYYGECYLYYYGYIGFDLRDTVPFELNMDENWMDYVPSELKVLCDDVEVLGYYDSFILINLDSGELNTLPQKDGTYRFMALYYSHEYSELYVAEYDVFYSK